MGRKHHEIHWPSVPSGGPSQIRPTFRVVRTPAARATILSRCAARTPTTSRPASARSSASSVSGLTNEEIAHRLGITLDGAKYHVSQILSKLGVATREEAAAVAWAAAALVGGVALVGEDCGCGTVRGGGRGD